MCPDSFEIPVRALFITGYRSAMTKLHPCVSPKSPLIDAGLIVTSVISSDRFYFLLRKTKIIAIRAKETR
jgi:hypothetical protein